MITKAVPARSRTRSFATGIDYITEHAHERACQQAGRSFEDGIGYASAPKKAAWVQLRGVTSVETAAIEMEAVAALSTRCQDPVYHLIVAYAKGEHPTREQVVSDAERLLKAIGMERNQYVLAAHQDTDDYHAHVIANRIGPDSRANDLWHERIKRERVCAEIAAERGWEIVVGHHNRDIVQRVETSLCATTRSGAAAERRRVPPAARAWRAAVAGECTALRARCRRSRQGLERPASAPTRARRRREAGSARRARAGAGIRRRVRSQSAGLRGVTDRCALRTAGDGVAIWRRSPLRVNRSLRLRAATPWADTVRPTILAAVDSAKTWGELTQRLDRDGIVIKLIQRGARVQGLAFAAGSDPEAPGCGASRIHPRCKKAALEQRFGPCPFTPERPPKRSRSALGDRAEREASSDPRWALRDAQRIADHARMRSEYASLSRPFLQ